MMYVEFMQNFLLVESERAIGCYTDSGLLSPKTFDSYFLEMMYVEFMKNFLLADLSELLALYSFWPPEPKNV